MYTLRALAHYKRVGHIQTVIRHANILFYVQMIELHVKKNVYLRSYDNEPRCTNNGNPLCGTTAYKNMKLSHITMSMGNSYDQYTFICLYFTLKYNSSLFAWTNQTNDNV